MLQKWNHIINNWINCYFDERDQDERNVNIQSLLNIISHLRENLNLDESKSSVLQAHTVEEFILEKYPSFKFENGTAVASCVDDIYLVASLLLFFVCVNSKDVDIKSAMCSKLSGDDQEIILKFSKCLMECSPITCRDVQTAITEACGQDMATIDTGRASVAETPPALRSLHNEVRRLQAALDAERFDRNYLQEELSRTNLRVKKLAKDKEQYKLDIMNLTAKMSLCCGGEHDARGAEDGAENSTKLTRQLKDMEERLVKTQEMLDDAAYERDGFKTKLESLKQDRDKWAALSQQESARAIQMAEELEAERRHLQSLRELVTELRQHNRLNGLDSSQLECDDPDASMQSIAHNLSVCSEACANVIEVQLSEERAKVEALKQQIQTLQREKEQLHITMEKDNSNHEGIIKQKDCVIEKLQQQLKKQHELLESLRKDRDHVTSTLEKYKSESRQLIEEKDKQILQLNVQLSSFQQEFAELETMKIELNKRIEILSKEMVDSRRDHEAEKIGLCESLAQEKTKYALVVTENEALHKQIMEEKAAKDVLETEKNLQYDNYKFLLAEKNELVNNRITLVKQLAEEKSLRQVLEEQNSVLLTQTSSIEKTFTKQVKNIEKKLAKEAAKSLTFLQDKESLKRKMIEVKSAKQLADKEKNNILVEKNLLEERLVEIQTANEELRKQVHELKEKKDILEQQYENEKAINDVLSKENKLLIQDLADEKSSKNVLLDENKCLLNQNESFKHDLLAQETAQQVLLNDKELLLTEKNELAQCLEVEKSSRDEIETEKKELSLKLVELKEQYTSEAESKQAKLEKIAEDVKLLQLKCEDREELTKQISTALSVALDKLRQDLKNEVIANEVLQRLINVETEDVPATDKCDLLINIANTLTTEVVLKENLEKALERGNMAQEELKEALKQKEKQILELETETSTLQQAITDMKIELAKERESHTIALDNKTREIELIQKENQSLTNNLNDVKIQLDLKVYSLKEKLVDNENLTDKLKKTYECQIDNLNMMITKFTNYLKEKSTELDIMRKEKEKLQQVVEEHKSAIKCLEEEVKTEKLNQEKLINDFESERQVLKNMVTVTESVMEDHKVALNNAVSEHVKINEMLQEENRGIKELIENESRKYEQKIQEKDTALESIQKELAQLRLVKEEKDKEVTLQKEALDKEIMLLKSVVQNKEDEVGKLKEENHKLEIIVQNYKDNITSCTRENSELKINMDSVEVELRHKIDTLNESLHEQIALKKALDNELKGKTKHILELENKLQQLEFNINDLEQEKTHLINENDDYETKVNEKLNMFMKNSLKDAEEIEHLKVDKAQLKVKFNELENEKKELSDRFDELKIKYMESDEDTEKLKKNNKELAENTNKLKSDNTELVENIEKLRKENTALESRMSELNNEYTDIVEELAKLKKYTEKLEAELKKLRNDNPKLEQEISSLKKDYTNSLEALGKLTKDSTVSEEELSKLKQDYVNTAEALGKLQNVNTELEEELSKLKKVNATTVEELGKSKAGQKELEEELENLKKENMDLAEELSNLKKVNKDCEGEFGKLKKDSANITEALSKWKSRYSELEVQLEKFKKDNTDITEKFEKLKECNMHLEEELSKLKKDNTTLNGDLDKLKKDNANISEALFKSKMDNTGLEGELAKFKMDNADAAEELDKLKKDNTELERKLGKLKNDNTNIEKVLTKCKQDNTDITEELNKFKQCNTELQEELEKLKTDNMELQKDLVNLKKENKSLAENLSKFKKDNTELEEELCDLKKDIEMLQDDICKLKKCNADLKQEMGKLQKCNVQQVDEINASKKRNKELLEEVCTLNKDKTELTETIGKLEKDNLDLANSIVKKKTVITNLETVIKDGSERNNKLREEAANEKVSLVHKCDILQDYHSKAEKELEARQQEIVSLRKEIQTLVAKVELCEEDSKAKDGLISKMSKEKDAIISNVTKGLIDEKVLRERYEEDLKEKIAAINELKQNLNIINNEREALNILKKENEELIKAVGHRETFAVRSQEITSTQKFSGQYADKELRDLHHQVDSTSDLTHSSMDSLKTITDLEKIILDKSRTITTLQSDVTYLKTLMGESENKLLDVTKELEVSKENCHQLSIQLKKIVHQKNEEIADLKKQVTKMSVTENRATQIIKVSAKYQAIILKRIAEIKSNTVLKELTNFGNSNNCDNDLRRSLTAGSITMEDLENFLETTERHLKKCSEKQVALQKERDRLTEVNRINESEIINLKKFLTELSVSFQTFSSVKDLYAQKLSRVISVQRTVRREILSLDGNVPDACMSKLERGYAAVMQDLAECALNLERWVERCIGRTISSEKIKQAFLNDSERTSLAPASVQNAGLEVQLDELEGSFRRLLEDAARAAKGARPAPAPAASVAEVRAEYEDKLNRMKAKMKQLYTEQISVFKEKQKEEIVMLERELARAREKLSQSSRAYEDHIRGLTTELWSVGEKFLMKKDEAEWLRRKQRSGSLMSLQHVHSSGLVPTQEEPGRPSDTYSLRSLPVNNNASKREGRGLHMSDEEGEVFDNRCLTELATPRREPAPGAGPRLSELRWRNSLCPPHLKSSYPAETQFAPVMDEEEIKALGAAGTRARKEVGITAYKKPGPPTPSKQAGRLSATDSELRESMRVEADPQPSRKTSTPSRIRALFRTSKTDATEGTPRSRRLSNIFKKK